MTGSGGAQVPAAARSFLVEQGLAEPGEATTWTPLTGGVSSELWRVEVGRGAICVKRALAKLQVAGDWHAPVSRNAVEWDWLSFAAGVIPGHVPVPLAHDPGRGLFAMSYLPVEDHPVWKARLLAGAVRPQEAAAVGDLVGRLHGSSAGDRQLARRFATDDNFRALRIEPYLVATARRHPGLAGYFEDVIARTAGTRLAVVHGDVSPKNVLLGPGGPVLIDAECAWYGDPAFDLAFVLNHLLLKSVVIPRHRELLVASADALVAAYAAHISWEPAAGALARAATLLPALLLARVDGLSPVEYLDQGQQAAVRDVARQLAARRSPDVQAIVRSATQALSADAPLQLRDVGRLQPGYLGGLVVRLGL